GRGPARRRRGPPRQSVQARRPGGAAAARPRPRAPRRARGAPRLRPAGALARGALRPGAGALGGDLRARVGVAAVLGIEGGLGGALRATPSTVAAAKTAIGRRVFRGGPR